MQSLFIVHNAAELCTQDAGFHLALCRPQILAREIGVGKLRNNATERLSNL